MRKPNGSNDDQIACRVACIWRTGVNTHLPTGQAEGNIQYLI